MPAPLCELVSILLLPRGIVRLWPRGARARRTGILPERLARTRRIERRQVPSLRHPIAQVFTEERERIAADLHQPRDRARADLVLQLLLAQVRGHDHRPSRLVALVDDRIEL